jgi:ketosteroid isomerase-like protein
METEATRELANRLYEKYRGRDAEGVAAMIHDDIEWIIHGPIDVFPFEGPRRGKAAVLEALAMIARDYELRRHVSELMIAERDRAAVLAKVAFAQRSTGRVLSFRVVNILRFQDAQLIGFREFSDTFDVTQQALGRWFDVRSVERATSGAT